MNSTQDTVDGVIPPQVMSVVMSEYQPMTGLVYLNFEPTTAQFLSLVEHIKAWVP